MSDVELQDAIPILDVHDVERAVRFYVDPLGFQLEFHDDDHPDNYAGVSRVNVFLHMQWQYEDAFRDGTAGPMRVRVLIDDPDALFEEYRSRGVLNDQTQVRDTSWGTREFSLRDPDGNGLIFFRDTNRNGS